MSVTSFDPIFQAAGQQYGVDPRLLKAQAWTESQDNPDAQSRAGAVGLMQFMPDTAASLGVDPHDPAQSIYGAARLMRQNYDRYGDWNSALMAYHGGTNQKNWGPLTRAYPGKVRAAMDTSFTQQWLPPNGMPFDPTYGMPVSVPSRPGDNSMASAVNSNDPTLDTSNYPAMGNSRGASGFALNPDIRNVLYGSPTASAPPQQNGAPPGLFDDYSNLSRGLPTGSISDDPNFKNQAFWSALSGAFGGKGLLGGAAKGIADTYASRLQNAGQLERTAMLAPKFSAVPSMGTGADGQQVFGVRTFDSRTGQVGPFIPGMMGSGGGNMVNQAMALNPQLIDLVGSGRLQMTPYLAARFPMLAAAVAQKYPSFDPVTLKMREKSIDAFSPQGKLGQQVAANNTYIQHLGVFKQAFDALQNGDVQALNKVRNTLKTQLGYSGPITLEALKQVVADEANNAIVSGGGGELERQQMQTQFGSANSPAQMASILDAQQRLASGRVMSLKKMYESGTKNTDFDSRFLLPETLSALRAHGYEAPPTQDGSSPQATSVPKIGQTITIGGIPVTRKN